MKPLKFFSIVFFTLLTFNSCVGITADISIRADGSGKIVLEYRVSQTLESIGRLDGNERWPAIPVGKGDFERGVARIPGLRLLSYSAKDQGGASGGRDLVTKATLEFRNTEALLAFLDASGVRASFVSENGRPETLLRLVLRDNTSRVYDPDLTALLREISGDYKIKFSLSAPKTAGLTLVPSSVPGAQVLDRGKTVSFSIGPGDLLSLDEGLALEISW